MSKQVSGHANGPERDAQGRCILRYAVRVLVGV
jgi:hypothetical protein